MGRLASETVEVMLRMGYSRADIARMDASPVAPAEPEDQPEADEPEKPTRTPPGGKPAKKKAKKEKHASLMASSPAYRHAYEDTRAMRDASAPMSTKTRSRLEERGRKDPFAPGAIMTTSDGKPAHRSVRELSERDQIAVCGGYDGADAVLAGRAALSGVTTRVGRSFISTMDPVTVPQTLAQAQRDRDAAKARADR